MAVRRAAQPQVHWSVWVFASVGLAFLAAGAVLMVRACVFRLPPGSAAREAHVRRSSAWSQIYAGDDPHGAPTRAYNAAVRRVRRSALAWACQAHAAPVVGPTQRAGAVTPSAR